jgi:hypothetical protein
VDAEGAAGVKWGSGRNAGRLFRVPDGFVALLSAATGIAQQARRLRRSDGLSSSVVATRSLRPTPIGMAGWETARGSGAEPRIDRRSVERVSVL